MAVLLLAWRMPDLIRRWHIVDTYPFQMDVQEGYLLNQAISLANNGTIYPSLQEPPFLVGNYPPLYPWVYGWFNGPEARMASLPIGRLLAQVSVALAALMLGLIVAARTRRVLPALLAPLLLLITFEVYDWSAYARVDLPALMLTLSGMAVFLLVRAQWGLVLAGVLFVAAGLTRQTVLLAPASCVVALAIHDRSRLMWLVGTMAVAGLVALGGLQWATDGEFFRHVVLYNVNRMDWTAWLRLMQNEVWFFYRGLLVGLVVLAMGRMTCHGLRSRAETPGTPYEASPGRFRELPHTRHAVGIYVMVSTLSLLSYAKVGAAPNYMLEPLAAWALWGAESMGRLQEAHQVRQGRRGRVVTGIAMGLAAAAMLAHGVRMSPGPWPTPERPHLGYRVGQVAFSSPNPTDGNRAVAHRLLETVRRTPGEVFCEEPIYTLLSDKRVWFEPFIMSQLAKEGRWNQAGCLDYLRGQRVNLLVIGEDLSKGAEGAPYTRYTQQFAEVLVQHYKLTRVWERSRRRSWGGLGGRYYVWRPLTE